MRLVILIIHTAIFNIALCRLGSAQDNYFKTDLSIIEVLDSNGDSYRGPPESSSAGWPDETPSPAGDDLWDLCKRKGSELLTQMSYSDYDAGQSKPVPRDTAQSSWSYTDLTKWGYHYDLAEDQYCDLDSLTWGIASFFQRIGISDKCVEEGGEWRARSITHFNKAPDPDIERKDQTYIDPTGQIRRMTGAYFIMATNPQGGIISQDVRGPRMAADGLHGQGVISDAELPSLAKVSDMLWAMWEHEIPVKKRKSLQFYVVLCIMNEVTLQVLKRALESAKKPLSEHEIKFDATSDAGRAILGTPIATGFAHFLIQHKPQLGLKVINDIYVFSCETIHGMPCLLFSVVDIVNTVPRPIFAGEA